MCFGRSSIPFIMITQIADDARPRLSRGVRMQIDRRTGARLLLFPEAILELNETAQEIVARCDGRAVDEIAIDLAEHYDVDLVTIRRDVRETLRDLQQRRLIEFE
jgi:coenzyme PQQ biosynthesis protein PqqD